MGLLKDSFAFCFSGRAANEWGCDPTALCKFALFTLSLNDRVEPDLRCSLHGHGGIRIAAGRAHILAAGGTSVCKYPSASTHGREWHDSSCADISNTGVILGYAILRLVRTLTFLCQSTWGDNLFPTFHLLTYRYSLLPGSSPWILQELFRCFLARTCAVRRPLASDDALSAHFVRGFEATRWICHGILDQFVMSSHVFVLLLLVPGGRAIRRSHASVQPTK